MLRVDDATVRAALAWCAADPFDEAPEAERTDRQSSLESSSSSSSSLASWKDGMMRLMRFATAWRM